MKSLRYVLPAALMAAAFAWEGLCAETVRVVDCVRDPSLDVWTASDVRYAHAVMTEVFKRAGISPEWTTPGTRASTPENDADVICSAFRTPELLEKYDFPLQPMNKMRFALYADPKRAKDMIATKLTDWDWSNMKVGYSPVAQGQSDDRTHYFEHARLSPGGYVEFPTSAGAVQALLGGDIDALFLYTTGACIPDRLAQIVPIGTRNAYFAVKKGKPELLAALVKAYRDFYIDDIEKIDALREKHLMLPRNACASPRTAAATSSGCRPTEPIRALLKSG